MSYGRFASIGIASAAGVLGGYYTFKPELDGMQKEKELKEQSNAVSGNRNVIEKPADPPAGGHTVKVGTEALVAASDGQAKGRP